MKQRACQRRVTLHWLIVIILPIFLWFINSPSATAQNIEDYFQLTYEPVVFSKTEIQINEDLDATIRGLATCTRDLPVPASEASITSQIVAEHAPTGIRVTLNPSYTIAINPFPSKKGDTAEIYQVVPLKFPAEAEPGDYTIIGVVTEAKVKVAFAWLDITGFIPREQLLGAVKYAISDTAQAPKPTTTPLPTPEPKPELSTASTPTPTPKPSPTSPIQATPWWMWLAFAAAVITTIANIVWLLRHR